MIPVYMYISLTGKHHILVQIKTGHMMQRQYSKVLSILPAEIGCFIGNKNVRLHACQIQLHLFPQQADWLTRSSSNKYPNFKESGWAKMNLNLNYLWKVNVNQPPLNKILTCRPPPALLHLSRLLWTSLVQRSIKATCYHLKHFFYRVH